MPQVSPQAIYSACWRAVWEKFMGTENVPHYGILNFPYCGSPYRVKLAGKARREILTTIGALSTF